MNLARIALLALPALLLPSSGFAECISVVPAPVEVPRNITVHLEYSGKPLAMPLSVTEVATKKVVREVTTDADGKAELRDLTPGLYEITSPAASGTAINVVAKDGHDDVHVAAIIDQRPVDLKLVDGIVGDPSGAVIPGAVVVVEQIDRWHTPLAVTKADEDGRISLKVPPGIYQMKVAMPGFQIAVFPVRVIDKGWESFRLTMQVGGCPELTPQFTIRKEIPGPR